MKRRLGSCLLILALTIGGAYATLEYVTSQQSATAVMRRLTGIATKPSTAEQFQQQLREQLPVSTPKLHVITFLEQHGVERDRFGQGQYMRYQEQPEQHSVFAILTDPDYLLNFPCRTNYFIRFTFDSAEQLSDLSVENGSMCL